MSKRKAETELSSTGAGTTTSNKIQKTERPFRFRRYAIVPVAGFEYDNVNSNGSGELFTIDSPPKKETATLLEFTSFSSLVKNGSDRIAVVGKIKEDMDPTIGEVLVRDTLLNAIRHSGISIKEGKKTPHMCARDISYVSFLCRRM